MSDNESEAMEVWRKAIDAASDSSIKFKTRADQAAARVIATALEARDAYFREQLKVDEEILADYKEREAEKDARIRELEGALEDVCNPLRILQRHADESGRQLNGMAYSIANDLAFVQQHARAILTKQEPKS